MGEWAMNRSDREWGNRMVPMRGSGVDWRLIARGSPSRQSSRNDNHSITDRHPIIEAPRACRPEMPDSRRGRGRNFCARPLSTSAT